MRIKPRERGLLHGVLVLALASLLAACGSAGPAADSAGHTHDDADGATVDVGDYLGDAGLAELSQASDLVVSGRVAALVKGVPIGSEPSARYTVLTVAVDETVKGDARKKTVDVAMLAELRGVAVTFGGRPIPRVNDRGVWLLRRIAPEFGRDGYVLTNQNGQILAGAGGLTGGAASSPSAREVKQLGDLTSVLDHLRAVVD
jgi:hypothetical protein